MNTRRRLLTSKKKLVLYTKRFYPAGDYTWVVPAGCTKVDVFLVGGGGGAENAGGGGGYTKTFKSSTDGHRDGDAVSVIPGQSISITVGKGGAGVYNSNTDRGDVISGNPGGHSQFKDPYYRAYGGKTGSGGYLTGNYGGDGGSGGGSYYHGGSDGNDGEASPIQDGSYHGGTGQHYTTRDFGESSGKRNAGGGSGGSSIAQRQPGASDYTEGSGKGGGIIGGGYPGLGGGGYGGGGGAGRESGSYGGSGGDGTVLIRYYAYEQ